jgi:hypothetical protein
LVLENPGPFASTPQAQAEARNIIVEEDRVCLAGRQGKVVDCRLGEHHGGFDPILGMIRESRSSGFMPHRAVISKLKLR